MEKTNVYEFNCVEVISKYIKVRKQGGNYVACCPFHHEDTASLTINPHKNFWSCFGCKKGGNAVQFVSMYENISYKDAYIKLCVEYGYMSNKVVVKKTLKEFEINDVYKSFFRKSLEYTQFGLEVKKYLSDRGIDDSLIKEFEIGCSVDSTNDLKTPCKSLGLEMGYTLEEIKSVGILNTKEGDLYQKRVILPIKNEKGEVEGFVGRAVKEDLVKYLNTPETKVFKKSKSIFNIDKAIPEIRKADEVIICEGSFDVIACYKADVKNVVCSLGCALTKEQLLKLGEYTKNITLLYDGDKAGTSATIKAFKLCKSLGFNFKCCLLPNGMDPDEFNKVRNDLKDYVSKNKTSIFNFFISLCLSKKRTPEAISKFQEKYFELLTPEKGIIQKTYLEKWAKALVIDDKIIKKEFVNFNSSKDYLIKRKEILFNDVINLLLSSKKIFNDNYKLLNPIFLNQNQKTMLNAIYSYYKNNKEFNLETFNIQTNGFYFGFLTSILTKKIEKSISELMIDFSNTSMKLIYTKK